MPISPLFLSSATTTPTGPFSSADILGNYANDVNNRSISGDEYRHSSIGDPITERRKPKDGEKRPSSRNHSLKTEKGRRPSLGFGIWHSHIHGSLGVIVLLTLTEPASVSGKPSGEEICGHTLLKNEPQEMVDVNQLFLSLFMYMYCLCSAVLYTLLDCIIYLFGININT